MIINRAVAVKESEVAQASLVRAEQKFQLGEDQIKGGCGCAGSDMCNMGITFGGHIDEPTGNCFTYPCDS